MNTTISVTIGGQEYPGRIYQAGDGLLIHLPRVRAALLDLPAPDPDARAWRILAEAEEAFGAQSLARERAACGEWPRPQTIPDFLAWIEDEVANPPEEGGATYLRALRGVATELRQLGFVPAIAPWEAAS